MFVCRLQMAIAFTCVVASAFVSIGTFSGNWNLLSSFGDSPSSQLVVLFACWLVAPFFHKFFDEG